MTDLPEAKRRKGWWPGLIWAVPIGVLGIVGWLGVRALTSGGPEVAVTFAHAGGVQAGDTKVKYEQMNVGEVEDVSIASDLSHVTVTLRLDPIMGGHLGPGTRFWLAGETFNLGNPTAIKALISGPYIGIDPSTTQKSDIDHFDGLENPPVLRGKPAGLALSLQGDKLGNVQPGTPIFFRDVQVGQVTEDNLITETKKMHIEAFVQAQYQSLVTSNARFWNAGAVQLSLAGSGPDLQFQSVPALFRGAIAFDDFGKSGSPAKAGDEFALYDSKSAAQAAPRPGEVTYRVVFPEPAGDLSTGDPVTLMGAPVGYVRNVALEYDPETGALAMHASLALEPSRISLAGGQAWPNDPKPKLDAMLRELIARGLRADMGKSVPLVGSGEVRLAIEPAASPATLGKGDIPELPAGGSSDIAGVIASAHDILRKIDAMPLPQIARDIHASTERIAALSQSPQVTATLRRLDRSVANVERVTDRASAEVGPILAEVRAAARDAQTALQSAQQLLRSGGEGGPETAGMPKALFEVSRAARAVRELSDYLDRHPEALIAGKADRE